MAKSLTEAYAKRINAGAKFYAQAHEGKAMSASKQLALAMVLNNQNRILTEKFNNSVGTQVGDIKTAKKFVMNLTNFVVPNLIADEIVMITPMNSRAGF